VIMEYSILCMQIFPATVYFKDLTTSLFTHVQLLIGEGWNDVMYDTMLAYSPPACFVFLSFVVLNTLIFSNLFVGVIIDAYQDISGISNLNLLALLQATFHADYDGDELADIVSDILELVYDEQEVLAIRDKNLERESRDQAQLRETVGDQGGAHASEPTWGEAGWVMAVPTEVAVEATADKDKTDCAREWSRNSLAGIRGGNSTVEYMGSSPESHSPSPPRSPSLAPLDEENLPGGKTQRLARAYSSAGTSAGTYKEKVRERKRKLVAKGAAQSSAQ